MEEPIRHATPAEYATLLPRPFSIISDDIIFECSYFIVVVRREYESISISTDAAGGTNCNLA
jgi:hypothetical protein